MPTEKSSLIYSLSLLKIPFWFARADKAPKGSLIAMYNCYIFTANLGKINNQKLDLGVTTYQQTVY